METSKNRSINELVHGIQRFPYVFMLYIIYYDSNGNEQFNAIKNSLLANITHGLNDRKIKQKQKQEMAQANGKRSAKKPQTDLAM